MKAPCFVVLTALAVPALGQDDASVPAAPQVAGAEEIIVRGRAAPRLRIELELVENAFYERFNELNSRDEFDIVCMNEAPVGSHMPVRECLPEFALTAERRAAQETLRRMQGVGSASSNTQIHFMRIEQKGAELIEEMKRLAREDEQLMKDLTRLAELQQAVGGRLGKKR
jgi:hypothetical protein